MQPDSSDCRELSTLGMTTPGTETCGWPRTPSPRILTFIPRNDERRTDRLRPRDGVSWKSDRAWLGELPQRKRECVLLDVQQRARITRGSRPPSRRRPARFQRGDSDGLAVTSKALPATQHRPKTAERPMRPLDARGGKRPGLTFRFTGAQPASDAPLVERPVQAVVSHLSPQPRPNAFRPIAMTVLTTTPAPNNM